MYLGVDIGSSSSKVAIMDKDMKLAAVAVVNLGTGTGAYEQALDKAMSESGITMDDIEYTVVTGYGRVSFKGADKQITEITCHAKGVDYLMDGITTIIDIGGQDAKVIKLRSDGSVSNFVMNEKCAAGTGRFMEVMARVLGCSLDELSEMADGSDKAVAISNVCTVFAESEVISSLAGGERMENVARGAHVAVARRITGMCGRVGYEPEIAMTGGVALNSNFVDALSRELGCRIRVAPYCQEVGAIGAAVFAYEQSHRDKGSRSA